MNILTQFNNPKLPMLIAIDDENSFTLGIIKSPNDIKTVYKTTESINDILSKAAKILNLKDIQEALEEGDETFHLFTAIDNENGLLVTEHLVQQLILAQKDYLKQIDPDWSAEIQAEMTRNIQLDLAASFVDALIEQILLSLISSAQEVILDAIAFTGDFTLIPRMRRILTQELTKANITLYFPGDEPAV